MTTKEKTDKTVKNRKRKKRLFYLLILVLIVIAWQVVRPYFAVEEKSARQTIRETVERTFPHQSAKIMAEYGLKPYPDDLTLPDSPNQAKRAVILIHGLDDSGKIWMNLAPGLAESGFNVWIMDYPNDQPITESARLFLTELEKLRAWAGIAYIDIVAHSMGGLVARETISNPDWDYHTLSLNDQIPKVGRLIMVGTPNHGSGMARFRISTELRDQWMSISRDDFHWLRPIVDGAGEAGIDLLPNSRFLETLNSRPRPKDVHMLVIAGMISPWQNENIDQFIASAKKELPVSTTGSLDTMDQWLKSMADGVGDGLVTVDSAKLEGVDLIIVPGSHLSIIRNLTADSTRQPPAIPIIIRELSTPLPSSR